MEPRQASPAAGPAPQVAAPQASSHMLPVLIFGIVEVRRLMRELEALDEYMRQSRLREPGKQAALPRVSRLLDALATDNNRNLLKETDRKELYDFLTSVEKEAPCINISFASDPSSAFTAKIVTWLRTNVHPAVLLQTGLQPTIAAGCVMRTPNHSFDFSLRERFAEQRALLLQALDDGATTSAQPAVTDAAPAPVVEAATPMPQPEAQANTPIGAAA